MRRHALVLTVVMSAFLGACSEQPPEVSANDQVPAEMRVAEPSEGAEGGGGAEAATEGAEGEGSAPAEGEGEGGGEGASGGDAEALWVAEGIEFTSAPESMPADTAVTIGLEVVGALPHNVIFEDFRGDQVLVDGPGEGVYTSEVEVPAGTYVYYCGVVGHRAAGMEGEITVG